MNLLGLLTGAVREVETPRVLCGRSDPVLRLHPELDQHWCMADAGHAPPHFMHRHPTLNDASPDDSPDAQPSPVYPEYR